MKLQQYCLFSVALLHKLTNAKFITPKITGICNYCVKYVTDSNGYSKNWIGSSCRAWLHKTRMFFFNSSNRSVINTYTSE